MALVAAEVVEEIMQTVVTAEFMEVAEAVQIMEPQVLVVKE